MTRQVMLPPRLQAGEEIRVIAPSRSLAMIDPSIREIANTRFEKLGLRVTFGEYVEESDEFGSASIAHRVADLHAAFEDDDVKAIITVIGGFNANQLLPYLDWDLIRSNPKILCGYSDITALGCAIHAMTGLITYSGPHYSSFGMKKHFDQTLDWFRAALLTDGGFDVEPAATWADEAWFDDQEHRTILPNEGYWLLGEGTAEGPLIGGNLCTLNLLHGTPYMPDLTGAIVFVEDDFEAHAATFDRDLTSLTQQPGFDGVVALLIGRFQQQIEMTRAKLEAIVGSKRELDGLPIIANVDFGHTYPILTLPVGGSVRLRAGRGSIQLSIQSE